MSYIINVNIDINININKQHNIIMIKTYFGTSDYDGTSKSNTTHIYRELASKMQNMGLSDDDINSILHDVSVLESNGYRNGYDCASKECQEQ